ncbi:hypothetical protein CHS0354_008937 [Potamilus streckersoni]|uniref:Uncharacterized protein n=1 Tax=Potamilus streckersoni TaxID=2493646 RepID=A0AAE0THJ5_9BIVA|nr:hypothetical protein CHS0354_008937 [Potamilus streckersoni]
MNFEKPDSVSWALRQTQKKDSNEKFTVHHVEKGISNNVTMVPNIRKSNGSRRSDKKYLSDEPVIVDDHLYTKDLEIRHSNENKKY